MLAGNLEYLISSLPNLSFSNLDAVQNEIKSLFRKYASNAEASEDLVSILEGEALKYLSSTDFKTYQKIRLDQIHKLEFQNNSTSVVSEFSKFMYQLKSELKSYRLARRSEESSGKIQYEIIRDLSEDPLKAEEYLIDIKWHKLDDLSIGHYSNLSALVIYKLKLEVLLHWWQFDTEEGFEVFQQSLKVA